MLNERVCRGETAAFILQLDIACLGARDSGRQCLIADMIENTGLDIYVDHKVLIVLFDNGSGLKSANIGVIYYRDVEAFKRCILDHNFMKRIYCLPRKTNSCLKLPFMLHRSAAFTPKRWPQPGKASEL